MAKLARGRLSSVEQPFVGRDENRAPLKSPAWEARDRHTSAYVEKTRIRDP